MPNSVSLKSSPSAKMVRAIITLWSKPASTTWRIRSGPS